MTRFFIPGRPEENVLDLSTDYEAIVLWYTEGRLQGYAGSLHQVLEVAEL